MRWYNLHMVYTGLLVLHIAAAIATIGLIANALYIVLRGREAWYRFSALALAGVAAFEIISGTALTLLSPELTAASLTFHIVAYLGICAGVEALLFIKMKKISLPFPLAATASPVFASVCMFALALYAGL